MRGEEPGKGVADALNRLKGIHKPNGEYIGYTYDSRGNRKTLLTEGEGATEYICGSFSYDNWEQLNKFTTGTDSYTYKYDPEGLGSENNTPTTTARYHCNNGQV